MGDEKVETGKGQPMAATPELQSLDLSTVPDACAPEVLRQAELALAATLQAALAADQRANVRAGILGAAAAALLTAGLTWATGERPEWQAAIATWTMAAMVLVGAIVTGISARPIDFHFPGYEPSKLAKAASDLPWLQKTIAEQTQDSINYNRLRLVRSGRLFNIGSTVAAAGLPAAGVTYWVVSRLA